MREWDFHGGPVRLRVCEWGPSDGPIVLILHGFLEQGAAWDAVAAHLPGFRVLALDHRGHGLSGHVPPGGFYYFWDYVTDVDALVRHLGGRVHLVGHSMGGTISTYFAGARPEHIASLVLVEGLGPPDRTDHAVAHARTFLMHRAAPPPHKVLDSVAAAAGRMLRFNPNLGEPTALRLAQRITAPIDAGQPDGPVRWTWDARHRQRNPRPFDAAQFCAFLSAITAPTLAIDGGDSQFRVEGLDTRRRALKTATHVTIPGAGHLVHHDQPEALARLIHDHIRATQASE